MPKESRCIRIKDFARDKYQVFDGKEWLTVTLNYICEQYMLRIFEQYRPVIDEKQEKLNQINERYPRWKYPKKNMFAFDNITDMYATETTHFGELAIVETDLLNQIKIGVKTMLSAANKST